MPKTELCPEHKKEIILFCEEEGCKKPICKTCLTKQHKRHDVIEIEEKKKEELLKDIDNTKMNLTEKIVILSQAKDKVSQKTKVTVNDLKKAKQEVDKKFDMMIKEAEKKMRDADTRIDNDVAMIKENIVLLDQMKVNISTEKELTTEGLIDGEETVAEVRNIVKVNISGNKTFNVKTFQANAERFEEEAITVVLPEITTVEYVPAPGKPIPIVTDASELKWKGKIQYLNLMSQNSICLLKSEGISKSVQNAHFSLSEYIFIQFRHNQTFCIPRQYFHHKASHIWTDGDFQKKIAVCEHATTEMESMS